jgi:predicted acyltransferase
MNNSSQRLLSLDAFRGLTIAAMILVNTPGSWSHVYPPLLHASWHGWTPTDLVFPFFLFIVGVSMRFSFSKFNYEWSGEAGVKLLKRSLLIFVIGLLLNALPLYDLDLSTLRIMGVLQRIALAFGVGGLIVLTFRKSVNLYLIIAGILLGYWGLLYFFGGSDPYGLENNLVRQIDLAILGSDHLYNGFGIPFDPEGILSTLPSVGTVLIGFLIGKFIKNKIKTEKDLLMLIGIGSILVLAGLIWNFVFPVNKPIWTSSYVLLTSGLATILLSLFYWLIDVKSWKRWSKFFLVFGVNPLFAYVLSAIWVNLLYLIVFSSGDPASSWNLYDWLYENVFASLAGKLNGSLLFALTHVGLYWGLLYYLYRRKIFIKI